LLGSGGATSPSELAKPPPMPPAPPNEPVPDAPPVPAGFENPPMPLAPPALAFAPKPLAPPLPPNASLWLESWGAGARALGAFSELEVQPASASSAHNNPVVPKRMCMAILDAAHSTRRDGLSAEQQARHQAGG
jgi:hypothetical protein